MSTCTRCGDTTHRDFPDKREHCSGCDRVPAFCRCVESTAAREPLWLERSRARRGGLSRDETGALVA